MCTAITYQDRQDNAYFGRTMDFPLKATPWRLTYVPAGFAWQVRPSEQFLTSKYAVLGGMRLADGHYLIGDGVNEAGLACAELYFPGQVQYYETPQFYRLNLTPQDVITWLLTQHQSVAEVADNLDRLAIIAQQWYDHDIIHPFHWILSDDTGTYLIEPTNEQLSLKKAPLGILTNAPAIEQHQAKLTHLVGGKPTKERLAAFPKRLPVTRTPSNRYLRTALTLAKQPVPDHRDGILLGRKILERVQMEPLEGHDDYTHYIGVIDRTHLTYDFTDLEFEHHHRASLRHLMKKYHKPVTFH